MSDSKVDEILKQGIYGKKEIKPEERRKFLGTLRERVLLALTQPQVRTAKINPEAERLMKENPTVHVYLNGHIDFSYLSKYMKLARKHKLKYTIVTNKDHNSPLGLILAFDTAIDKENIYWEDTSETPKIVKPAKKMSLKETFKKWINK